MQTSPHMEQKKDQPHLPKVAVSQTRAKCVSQSPSWLQDLCIYPRVLPSEDYARVPELGVMQPPCRHKHVHARRQSMRPPVMGKHLWEVTKSAEMRSNILVLFWSDSAKHIKSNSNPGIFHVFPKWQIELCHQEVLVFVLFSWWLNMFSPVLIATFDRSVCGIWHRTNSMANIWWSNRDEVLLGNKTLYLYV